MRKFTIIGVVALSAAALAGCETTTNTNVNKAVMNANSNTAVIVNNNSNVVMNSKMDDGNMSSSNISREEYDKNKAKYEAEKGASTIGQGANDSYIWFKTKTALATTNDLRDSTINVDVTNDMITLKGTVTNAEQKAKAESVAKGIDGQKGVKNELKVQAGDSMTNQMVNGNSNTKMTNTNMKK